MMHTDTNEENLGAYIKLLDAALQHEVCVSRQGGSGGGGGEKRGVGGKEGGKEEGDKGGRGGRGGGIKEGGEGG